MIRRIFWDIDETLIHTEMHSFGEGYDERAFNLPDDGFTYYTIIRPCSKNLIEFSRNLVGFDNVYILTTATRDYAREINRLAGWEFPHEQIFSREDLHEHRYSTAYGGSATAANRTVADPNNVLIDNLPCRENWNKCSFIGINDRNRYLHISDYYGVNYPDDSFPQDVQKFLTRLHND